MSTYVVPKPVLYHDGSPVGDALRQALEEEGEDCEEVPSEEAVVIHEGNCYFSPDTVRGGLCVRLRGYRRK